MSDQTNTNSTLSNQLSSPYHGDTNYRLSETFVQLIDVMDIAMWQLDLDYHVVGFNRKAREIYGDNTLGQFCYKVAAQRDTICDKCPAQHVIEGHSSGRSEHQRTSTTGEHIFIDHIATPIRDNNGTLSGVLVFIIDITKHKTLEQELINHRTTLEEKVLVRTRELEASQNRLRSLYQESKRTEALYQSLLNSSVDAIVIYDMLGHVQYLSPSFSDIFGWQTEELQGHPIPFVPESETKQTQEKVHQVLNKGLPIRNFQTRRLTRDGKLVNVYITASRYNDHAGKPAGMLCVLKDITESKAMEQQLHQAQKFNAMGTLAGGIAHNFNNLLMGVQGNTALLLRSPEINAETKQKLHNIEDCVRRGAYLTRQLLGMVREGKYEVKPIDINFLLTKSLSLFGQTNKNITITNNITKNSWTVEGDKGQLEQVFLNLFVNAAQAMPSGGDLCVTTENKTLQANVTSHFQRTPGPYISIVVTDTGCGIDPTIQEKIFEPFFTTKAENQGTGLGLASAQGIVTNHGGFIQAGNTPSGGAQFSIHLPASNKPEPVISSPRKTAALRGGNQTILLVDDEATVRETVKDLLETLGYSVISTSSGEEAVEKYCSAAKDIDLVILDMIMPGIGGAETFKRLLNFDPTVKVLLATGYGLNNQAATLLQQGCQGLIQKPYTLDKAAKKIHSVFNH